MCSITVGGAACLQKVEPADITCNLDNQGSSRDIVNTIGNEWSQAQNALQPAYVYTAM